MARCGSKLLKNLSVNAGILPFRTGPRAAHLVDMIGAATVTCPKWLSDNVSMLHICLLVGTSSQE